VSVHCPICSWTGRDWYAVESRPNGFARKICPQCGGYPRDRITFILLRRLQQGQGHKRLVIGEIGGSVHSYPWKKKRYRYWNADIVEGAGWTVDVLVQGCRIQKSPPCADIAILSYVLSQVETKSVRIGLMKELHRLTIEEGKMIFFDDLELTRERHRVHPKGAFFHTLQLGHPIVSELKSAGWKPAIINAVELKSIQAEMEMPFILAAKSEALLFELLRTTRIAPQP
jgi:hypothetical protein